jgi:hypothetical protein
MEEDQSLLHRAEDTDLLCPSTPKFPDKFPMGLEHPAQPEGKIVRGNDRKPRMGRCVVHLCRELRKSPNPLSGEAGGNVVRRHDYFDAWQFRVRICVRQVVIASLLNTGQIVVPDKIITRRSAYEG